MYVRTMLEILGSKHQLESPGCLLAVCDDSRGREIYAADAVSGTVRYWSTARAQASRQVYLITGVKPKVLRYSAEGFQVVA